ncbi:hypothetical protein WICPIJ_001229 [Wickerhamomyces pijperi]|uniref:RRM domain-containing protein n=1 Tax=Wickerhamomyces pijperi TaxID=599730 RepID=A0A9P8QE48_WICPI|nr:hypothetical protein WICPIJ_001229 [Wickerhamomyces pijperi]
MTDTSKFRPNVSKLFEPNAPLRILQPIDYASEDRCTASISPLSQYLTQFKEYQKQVFPKDTEAEEPEELKKLRLKRSKHYANQESLRIEQRQFDPLKDPHIKGDPKKTLFIGRLAYDVDEVELQKEFLHFGEIEKVRIVRDKSTEKSKGYAFIVFVDPLSKTKAFKEANGMTIKGRKIITDHERARVEYGWLPRRLGGGLGGRGYLKREALKQKEYEDMKRRVESSASRGGFSGAGGRRQGAPGDFNRNGRGGHHAGDSRSFNSSGRYNNNNHQSSSSSSSSLYQTPSISSTSHSQRQQPQHYNQRYQSSSDNSSSAPKPYSTPQRHVQPYSTPSSSSTSNEYRSRRDQPPVSNSNSQHISHRTPPTARADLKPYGLPFARTHPTPSASGAGAGAGVASFNSSKLLPNNNKETSKTDVSSKSTGKSGNGMDY